MRVSSATVLGSGGQPSHLVMDVQRLADDCVIGGAHSILDTHTQSDFTPCAGIPPGALGGNIVIFIVVKFTIRADRSEDWLALVDGFTTATRREPGNVFFEWSRSVDTPDQFVLLEAFESAEAGERHVSSDHFKAAVAAMPAALARTPDIINVEVPGGGWGKMAELAPVGD